MNYEKARNNDFSDFENYLLSVQNTQIERKKGEAFSAANELFYCHYYLLSGSVQTYFFHESGNIKTSYISFKKGAIFPLYTPDSVADEQNYVFSATSDCKALILSRSILDDCLNSNVNFNRAMYACYYQLINNLNKELTNQTYLSGIENMCRFFCTMLQDKKENESIIMVSQDELCSYIGLNRSNIARCLKQLREDGVIETKRNKIIIKDIKKLYAYSTRKRNKA